MKQDPRFATAAAFQFLNEGRPSHVQNSDVQLVVHDTIVYQADMDQIGSKKLSVQDLAAQDYAQRAELLNLMYEPQQTMFEPEALAMGLDLIAPRLYADGTYLVFLGLRSFQAWCFDESTKLADEDIAVETCQTYYDLRKKAADTRATERRLEATKAFAAIAQCYPGLSVNFKELGSFAETIVHSLLTQPGLTVSQFSMHFGQI